MSEMVDLYEADKSRLVDMPSCHDEDAIRRHYSAETASTCRCGRRAPAGSTRVVRMQNRERERGIRLGEREGLLNRASDLRRRLARP